MHFFPLKFKEIARWQRVCTFAPSPPSERAFVACRNYYDFGGPSPGTVVVDVAQHAGAELPRDEAAICARALRCSAASEKGKTRPTVGLKRAGNVGLVQGPSVLLPLPSSRPRLIFYVFFTPSPGPLFTIHKYSQSLTRVTRSTVHFFPTRCAAPALFVIILIALPPTVLFGIFPLEIA